MCSGSSKVRANRGNGDWSCSGLRRMDCNLGSAKSVDFVRVSDMQRIKHGRRKVLVIRNSNPSSDIAELQASSEGSPLLVIIYLYFTDDDYQKELEHIEQVFTPLVENCNKYGRATRIGTNHGSLSDRIMSYYGDSPRGMVESAFEFARICRKLDYHNFVFSMKASNPIIMVQAYRLLVAEMYVQGWDYPLHLEADGRMKSAIGIGTLLQDGLGDTIRVSLTEPPEEEIDPCRRLANLGMKASDLQQGVTVVKRGIAMEQATDALIQLTKDHGRWEHIEQ